MNGYVLGKEDILVLLDYAKKVQSHYEAKQPKKKSHETANGGLGLTNQLKYWDEVYASTDEMALRVLEKRGGFVTTGVTIRGDNVKLRGTIGMVEHDGNVFSGNGTLDITLEDFADSTTLSRFGLAVCDVVERRVNNGNPKVKAIMMPNAVAFARNTREEINSYIVQKYRTSELRNRPFHG